MTAESQAPKPETLNLIFDWVKDARPGRSWQVMH